MRKGKMKHFIALLALASECAAAFAQGYPNKPVRLVGFRSGGAADISRAMSDLQLTRARPGIVDNKPGAGSSLPPISAARPTATPS
jgi:tripartite-type tricarboxylate transporter receptor subunit TctC